MAANHSSRSRWITGKNASSFKKLFSLISKEFGCDNNAIKQIGIGVGTYYRMRDESELTTETGRRILNAHKMLFKKKMKGLD